MSTVNSFYLSEKQFKLLCSVINIFGSGQHPWADSSSIDDFQVDYVLRLIKKATKKVEPCVVADLNELATAIQKKTPKWVKGYVDFSKQSYDDYEDYDDYDIPVDPVAPPSYDEPMI